MSKFRIKMKLQGFELEVEGSREDASLISRNLGEQMSSLLQPAGAIIEGEIATGLLTSANNSHPSEGATTKKARRRRHQTVNVNGEVPPAIDFKHDSGKFGNPKQDWKTAQKAQWLLYVAKEVTGIAELSAKDLVTTFNKHFRQSGTITASNVTRDLGRLKVTDTPSPVGEDPTKSPPLWYLTDEGRKRAQGFVAEALGQSG